MLTFPVTCGKHEVMIQTKYIMRTREKSKPPTW